MPFPFSTRYDKLLNAIITPDNHQQALLYIQKRILEDQGDNVVVENDWVTYKGSTSNLRQSLFGPVDSGVLTVVSKNNRCFLRYEIKLYRLFIIAFIMSVIAELISIGSGDWWFGVFAFLWLGGMNWIIAVVRHEALAARIAAGIDDLFQASPPEEDDDEKLKSWF